MINSLHFLGNSKLNLNNNKNYKSAQIEYPNDCFIKEQSKKDISLEYAKNKILQKLNDEGVEYSFVIAPDGEIIKESEGNSKSVSVNYNDIVQNAILMHGHPEKLPLSTGDVAILLSTNAKSEEAIAKDGTYSKLTKLTPFEEKGNYHELYGKLEKELCEMGLEKLGYDYKTNKDDVFNLACEYLNSITMQDYKNKSYDEIAEILKKFELELTDNIDENYKKISKRYSFQSPYKNLNFDKAHNLIMENYDELMNFLNSEEGIKLRHEFLEKLAEKYNLLYESNMCL